MNIIKIFGPPGTGKTTALLDIFAEELKTVEPKRIGFLTFTRSANSEALNRGSLPPSALPYVRTIHSFCYRVASVPQTAMLTESAMGQFSKMVNVPIKGGVYNIWTEEAYGPQNFDKRGEVLIQIEHFRRHKLMSLETALDTLPSLQQSTHRSRWFLKEYKTWKESQGLLDFTDLLQEFLDHGHSPPLDVLIIDEAQDLSPLQWKVIWKVAEGVERVYIAGDDDQTIFEWAGADPKELIGVLPGEESRILTHSYRLPRKIFEVSQGIVQRIETRREKKFTPRDAPGVVDKKLMMVGHDLKVHEKSTFVLYRNNFIGLEIRKELEERGIAFGGVDSILNRKSVRSYLERRLDQPSATHKFPRLPPRISQYLFELTEKYTVEELLKPGIILSTIHKSKGKEADHVILHLGFSRNSYNALLDSPDKEHRVWYVGVTRARERLTLVKGKNFFHYKII